MSSDPNPVTPDPVDLETFDDDPIVDSDDPVDVDPDDTFRPFVTPILNVSDVAASVRWFEKIGWKLDHSFTASGQLVAAGANSDASGAVLALIKAGHGQIFLNLDSQGRRDGQPVTPGSGHDVGSTWECWWLNSTAEFDAMHKRVVAAGITVVSAPEIKTWGEREMRIAHPDGHVFRISATVPPSPPDDPAAIIVNGSFEQGPAPTGNFRSLKAGDQSIPGWTARGHGVNLCRHWQPAGGGRRTIDLNNARAGAIEQRLHTTPGAGYQVTWAMAGNPEGGPAVKAMTVIATGGKVARHKFNVTGKTRRKMGWTNKRYAFTATNETTVLKFASAVGGKFGPAIDNVRVAKVSDGPLPPLNAFVSPILNVSDMTASVRWFEALGWDLDYCFAANGQLKDVGDGADATDVGGSTFVCLNAGYGQLFLSLDSEGLRGGKPAAPGSGDDVGSTWETWWLSSAAMFDALHQRAVAAGATIVSSPEDKPWGQREMRLAHPDGHVFRVCAPIA